MARFPKSPSLPAILAIMLIVTLSTIVKSQSLVVGTKPAEPFVIKQDDGTWSGIAIDLWEDIAREMELEYEIVEYDLEGLQAALADGSVDVGAAALTMTADRERRFDFTHPYFSTGLAIATVPKGVGWTAIAERFFSIQFLEIVLLLAAVLLGVGLLIWLFERRKNAEEFGGTAAEGIGSGFWWSAVTMTTVGYGDKAPRTFMGRILGLVWMFLGIIIISSFTAAITSALTVGQLSSKVSGPQDLPSVKVGSIANSTSAKYLDNNNVSFVAYTTPLDGLQAVAAGEIDAFVYDAPILRYLINENLKGDVVVLPQTFSVQEYSIALPEDSDLKEALNRRVLRITRSPEWNDRIARYLGD